MTIRPYDHSAIVSRSKLELPGGARVGVWFGVNVEHYPIGTPALSMAPFTMNNVPDPLNFSWREYGVRVGIWRVMEALEEAGLRPCALLNSDVCTEYPEIVPEGVRRGWSWIAHGANNTILQHDMSYQAESEYIADVRRELEKHCGTTPIGWLTPVLQSSVNTVQILAEQGFRYILDWTNDDQPYRMRTSDNRPLYSVPYSSDVNDIPMLALRYQSSADFEAALREQFVTLYREGARTGRIMGVGLHPFLVGQPYQIGGLRRALDFITGHDDVWLTTADEIATWYAESVAEQ